MVSHVIHRIVFSRASQCLHVFVHSTGSMFHYIKFTNFKFSSHRIENEILSSRLKLERNSPVPCVSDRIPYHCPFKWN